VDDDLSRRSFWETYTLTNIRGELAHRLAGLRRQWHRSQPFIEKAPAYDDRHAGRVGRFYDRRHEQFMAVYGPVIQAFRTTDVRDLLDYQIESIGLASGQRVLDAGCGVGAPAIHFAKHVDVRIDAITISKTQFEAALQRISDENLLERVRVVHGDYHRLPDYFTEGGYDLLYFLESFGHSTAKRHLLDICWRMLRPGGVLYIKDLFKRLPLRPGDQVRIDREVRKINEAYHYDVSDLNEVLDMVRSRGFILAFLKDASVGRF
jgi:ubiquinone/menaquinone biosynthesis C-methylase UbiE